MNYPTFSKEVCFECKTKKRMMRFLSPCNVVICLNCNTIHPNNCNKCKEIIKNKIIPEPSTKYRNNDKSYGQVF